MQVAIAFIDNFTQSVWKWPLFLQESSWNNSRKTIFMLEDETDAYQFQYSN
jgi:hypothetical protein